MKANPKLGTISSGDLGLKAAYINQKAGDVSFLPIVGWCSVTNYIQAGALPFAALVISADHRPVFANSIIDYVGTFPKEMTSAQVVEKLRAGPKVPRPPSTHPGPLE
jgi:hypothetical protein